MHVVLVSSFYYPTLRGGAEHTIQYLAEALVRAGVQVSVVSLNDQGKEERYQHKGVECRSLPVRNLAACLNARNPAPAVAKAIWHLVDVYNPLAGRVLEQHLRDLRPDIVQTHNLPGWSCAAWTAARRTCPIHVQVLHDYQLTCPTATRFRNGTNCISTCASCRPFSTLRQRLSQRVTHVVANSDYTRQLHRQLGFFRHARSFDVIHGAVPTPPNPPENVPAGRTLRIGYLGRLHPTKGLDLLIDAFLAANLPGATLRIAGRGTEAYEAELRQKTRGLAVEFVGQQESAKFLSTLDVLVAPSLWNEPMGRVVIEAATQGVPVIASNRGGIPELVDEGKTGWLFDPATPAPLEKILRQLTPTRLGAMREDCRQHAEKFSPENIAAQWLNLYATLRTQVSPNVLPSRRPEPAPIP